MPHGRQGMTRPLYQKMSPPSHPSYERPTPLAREAAVCSSVAASSFARGARPICMTGWGPSGRPSLERMSFHTPHENSIHGGADLTGVSIRLCPIGSRCQIRWWWTKGQGKIDWALIQSIPFPPSPQARLHEPEIEYSHGIIRTSSSTSVSAFVVWSRRALARLVCWRSQPRGLGMAQPLACAHTLTDRPPTKCAGWRPRRPSGCAPPATWARCRQRTRTARRP